MQEIRPNDHSVMEVMKNLRTGASCRTNRCFEMRERFTSSMLGEKVVDLSRNHPPGSHSGMDKGLGSRVHSSSTSCMPNSVGLDREVTSSGSSIPGDSKGVSDRVGTDVVHGLEGVPYIGC
jgi:hypothetical protein